MYFSVQQREIETLQFKLKSHERGSHLVSLQHIQAEQHVHRLVLQDGERTRKEVSLYLDLSCRSKTRQFQLKFIYNHVRQ